MYKEIGVDYRIEFGNVHRFSHKPRGQRPIVARFLYHSDLQYVLNNAYQLCNTPYGIRQQFPKEIEDNRRKLYPIQKEAKRQEKHVVLVRDRLYIDNERYVAPHEYDQMDDIEPTRPAENVLAIPSTTGGRRPPKYRRVSSSTPNGIRDAKEKTVLGLMIVMLVILTLIKYLIILKLMTLYCLKMIVL